MLSIALRVSMVLLLTSMVAWCLQRASAATRHVVRMVGLCVALLIPITRLTVPEWSAVQLPALVPELVDSTSNMIGASITNADLGARLNTALFLIWATGALLVLARVAGGQLVLARWKRHAQPVHSIEWRRAIAVVSGRLAATRRVTFLECEWIDTPCTWGILNQTVLLPSAGARWLDRERECAVMHELAHVRRCDAATHLIGRLACAIHWYNPMIWSAVRSASLAQEEACDDAVLAHHVVASDYAALLINVTNSRSPGLSSALALVRPTGTEARVRSVLDAHRRRAPINGRFIAAGLILGTAMLLSIATVSPAQDRRATQTRPDSAAIADAARRVCAMRAARKDSNTAAQFTLTLKMNRGRDSTSVRTTTYDVVLKDCTKTAK
jgi:beta-lactamase regulating signal transducer with metallopeptidase domain